MAREMSVLEGTYRLTTILKAKKMVFIIQVVTLVTIATVLLFHGGFSLVPFYLPLDSFIYFVLVMLLVVTVEEFLFRILEIRFTQSDSRRYLMAKNTIRKSIILLIITVSVAVFLLLPVTSNTIEKSLGTEEVIESGEVYTFSTRDVLGLTRVSYVQATPVEGTGTIYLMNEEQYKAYTGGNTAILSTVPQRTVQNTVSIYVFSSTYEKRYVLFLADGGEGRVKISLATTAAPTFFTFVPILLFLMAGVEVVAIVYMTPIKKKYIAKSIYK